MSSQSTSGSTTTGSVTITGTFAAGQPYYLLVWHYSSQLEYFYEATWALTGTVKTYTVTLPSSVTGATLNKTGAQTVNYGATLSFTVTLNTGYTAAAPVVKYGSTTLTGTKSGNTYTYTTPAVTASTTVTVTTTPDTYTVSYNANGGSGAPGSQTKTYGVDLTLSSTTPTRTGYTFQGWGTSSGATSASYQPGGTYSANAGATLYAVWKINTYTISYNANGGSGAPGSQTKTYGVDLTLSTTSPTRTGYTFQGWGTSASATSASYQPGGTYSANAGATLYAVWKIKTYTVTLPSSVTGATLNKTGAQTVNYNSTLSFTVTVQTGYTSAAPVVKYGSTTLTGTKSGSTYSYTTPAVTANTTVTVTATPDTYTVTYYANGGDSTPAAQTKTYGVALTLKSAISRTGSSTTVTGYTVSYDANGGSGAPSSQTSQRTKTVGYVFKEWNTKSDGTGTSYAAGTSYTGNAALKLYAIWTPGTTYTNKSITLSSTRPTRNNGVSTTNYTLTFNANNGSGAPSAQTGTKTVTTTYTFQGWATSDGATTATYQPGDSMTPAANTTLYAVWSSSSSTTNATVKVPSTTPTRSGYTFVGWNTSSSATSKNSTYDPGNTVTLTGNKTVYAVWKALLSYTVSYDANGGSGAPNEQYVYQGSSLTLTTETPSKANVVDTVTGYTLTYNANSGTGAPASQTSSRTRTRKYAFDHWNTKANGSGTSYNAGATITPSGNLTLYAIYSLTNTSYVNRSLTVSSTIPTRNGYVFKEWNTQSNGSGTSVRPGGSFTPSANTTLYAIWAPNGLAHVYDESSGAYLSRFCKIWTDGAYQQHLPYVYENGEWVLRG